MVVFTLHYSIYVHVVGNEERSGDMDAFLKNLINIILLRKYLRMQTKAISTPAHL